MISGHHHRLRAWLWRAIALAFACLRLPAAVDEGSASAFGDQWRVTQWKAEHGLPQNTVRSILQTSDGYLWLATRAGLARFDGLQFTPFNAANTPEMSNDNCVTLIEDSGGDLWVGTEGGLLRRRNGRFEAVDLGVESRAQPIVRYLALGAGRGVWIAGVNGLYHLRDGKWERFSTEDGLLANNIRAVFEDSGGCVWVGVETGAYAGSLQRRRPGERRFEIAPGQATNLQSMVHCFLEDRPGSLWWGNNAGLHRLVDGVVRDYHMTDGLSGEVVRRLAKCVDGGVLAVIGERSEVKGRHGIVRCGPDFDVFHRVKLPETFLEADMLTAREDAEGNIWMGTTKDGLLGLHPGLFRSYGRADGLSSDLANSVCELSDRTMLVGTGGNLDAIVEGKVIAKWGDWANKPVGAQAKDGLGRLWRVHYHYVPDDQELYCSLWLGQDFVHSGNLEASRLLRDPINCLGCDSAGAVWIGQPSGVTRLLVRPDLSRTYERFSAAHGLSTNDVRTVLADRSGAVWLGTRGGGLNRWDGHRFAAFRKADGLNSDTIQTLFEDSRGCLWIGTDLGLSRLKNGRFANFTRREGLPGEGISQILEDGLGFLWLGSRHGVLRLELAELDSVAEGRGGRIHPVAFGESDGLPDSEISQTQPGACRGSDGRLWFPTAKGVAVVDPKTLRLNEVAPKVVIEQVKLDDQVEFGDDVSNDSRLAPASFDRAGRLLLPAGRGRSLQVRYTANTFRNSAKVRFQYLLEGLDSDWVDAGNGRMASYHNLRPGDYTFRVKAWNSHGAASREAGVFRFHLAPYFYETWLFYGATSFFVAALAFRLHRRRLAMLQRAQVLEHKLALAEERARIGRDIHDDLGSRLSQLAVLQELVRRNSPSEGSAQPHLEKLRATTAETFQALDEIVWAVNPKLDSLPGLVSYLRAYVPEFLTLSGIHARLDFPAEAPDCPLGAETRHHLFLVIKESLNNIVKHAQAKEVWVRLRREGEALSIVIEDDGRGFSPGPHAAVPSMGHGNGLANMTRRVAAIGGTIRVESEPGQGTKVTITVPLEREGESK